MRRDPATAIGVPRGSGGLSNSRRAATTSRVLAAVWPVLAATGPGPGRTRPSRWCRCRWVLRSHPARALHRRKRGQVRVECFGNIGEGVLAVRDPLSECRHEVAVVRAERRVQRRLGVGHGDIERSDARSG